MPTSRAILIGSALIAAAILVHAYATRPPRFAMLRTGESVITRLDTRTGEAVRCEWGEDDDWDCRVEKK
jgi:hypothetical protein